MPQPNTRASRARRAALLACIAAAAIATAAPAGAAKKPKAVVKVAPGQVTVYKTGDAPDALPADVQTAVMNTLTGYLAAATVTPLKTGRADDTALGATLALPVVARLSGTDRAILVDEGLPKSKSTIKVNGAPVNLTALADADGSVAVVTAQIDTTTTTKTVKGPLSIKRSGELVLEPDNGTWKITGYTLTVDRVGKGIKTTTTTAPVAPAATPTPTTAAR